MFQNLKEGDGTLSSIIEGLSSEIIEFLEQNV